MCLRTRRRTFIFDVFILNFVNYEISVEKRVLIDYGDDIAIITDDRIESEEGRWVCLYIILKRLVGQCLPYEFSGVTYLTLNFIFNRLIKLGIVSHLLSNNRATRHFRNTHVLINVQENVII